MKIGFLVEQCMHALLEWPEDVNEITKYYTKAVSGEFCVICYTPPLKCGEVLCYTFRCLSFCPSVRPSIRPSVRPSVPPHHFRSITWVFIHGMFSNFAYILLSAMSGMGLLMGKIRPFLTELLPFFVLEKWFLACYSFTIHDIWMKLHRYVAHQRLHILTKDVTLTFPVCELSALDRSEKRFLTYCSFTMWNIWI